MSDQDRVAQDNQRTLLPAGETSKSARIKKLRHSQPPTATGSEWQGKYELNPRSAQSYIKDQLRGSYTVSDTGDVVKIVRNTAGELLSHDRYNEAHLKSIALTPRLIEHGIFIDELPNDRGGGNYEKFRYSN